jgi:hypothetical protein
MLMIPMAVTKPGRPRGGAEEYCNGVTGMGAALGVGGIPSSDMVAAS